MAQLSSEYAAAIAAADYEEEKKDVAYVARLHSFGSLAQNLAAELGDRD